MLNRNNSLFQTQCRWIAFLYLLAGLMLLVLTGCGPKPKVVGIISDTQSFADTADGFISQMTEFGYEKDKDIIYKVFQINPEPVREREIIKKFVADKVDLILAFPAGPALLAKEVTKGKKIPVVFAAGIIEGNNLVKNVREPGGNITGIRFPAGDLTVKRLKILLQLSPKTRRILLIYQSNYPPALIVLTKLRPEALASGITLVETPVTSVDQIKAYLRRQERLPNIGFDAIMIIPDPLSQTVDGWASLSEFARKHKLPIVGASASQVYHGAIFTYIPDNFASGKLAAFSAKKIFDGIEVGTIPLVTPEALFKINYKLAKEINLTVSEALLSQADEIVR